VTEETAAPDAMVRLAVLVSRSEALVVASMLEDHGIPVCIGGSAHASVSVNSLALGGHGLWVPRVAHLLASELLIEVLNDEEWAFSYGLRRAVLRFLGLWAGLNVAVILPFVLGAEVPAIALSEIPLALLGVPANPQGRGDYNLHPDALPS